LEPSSPSAITEVVKRKSIQNKSPGLESKYNLLARDYIVALFINAESKYPKHYDNLVEESYSKLSQFASEHNKHISNEDFFSLICRKNGGTRRPTVRILNQNLRSKKGLLV